MDRFDLDSLLDDDIVLDEGLLPPEKESDKKTLPMVAVDFKPMMVEGPSMPSPVDMREGLELTKDIDGLFDKDHLNPLQQIYITALAARGTKTMAAKVAGVSMSTVEKWMREPKFREAMTTAAEVISDVLEQEALRRAMSGSDKLLITMLKAVRPDKYQTKTSADIRHTGEIVHTWADLAKKANEEPIEADFEEVEDE